MNWTNEWQKFVKMVSRCDFSSFAWYQDIVCKYCNLLQFKSIVVFPQLLNAFLETFLPPFTLNFNKHSFQTTFTKCVLSVLRIKHCFHDRRKTWQTKHKMTPALRYMHLQFQDLLASQRCSTQIFIGMIHHQNLPESELCIRVHSVLLSENV